MGIAISLGNVIEVNKIMLGKLINGHCPWVALGFSQNLFRHVLYSNGGGL
jgi:hypothetical protein